MNEVRLRLLRAVVDNDDSLNVSGIARLLEMSQPLASNGLRALQARGLIGVRRERYSVYYNMKEDRSLPEATQLRNAFVAYFGSAKLDADWPDAMMIRLKAFTHFNRLAMLRRLARGAATKSELEAASGIVVKTIEHHLRILHRAQIIEERFGDNRVAEYRLRAPSDQVVCELLRQTIGGSQSYVNFAKGTERDLRLICGKRGTRRFVKRKAHFKG